jgi:ribosomal protein L11 methyltransferase
MKRRANEPALQANVLRVRVRAEFSRAVMDCSLDAGASGAAQDADPNAEGGALTIYAEAKQLNAIERLLRRISPNDAWVCEKAPLDDDWRLKWTEHLVPVELTAGITLVPVTASVKHTAEVAHGQLYLETGLVFGFGEHPTTRMAARWLEGSAKDQDVLDFGSGSGVLALVAERVGARSVLGLDNDEESVRVALRNAARNSALRTQFALTPLESLEQTFDLVVANVDALTLRRFASQLCTLLRPGGRMALTGVLQEQQDELVLSYAAHAVALTAHADEDDWVLLVGSKRSAHIER